MQFVGGPVPDGVYTERVHAVLCLCDLEVCLVHGRHVVAAAEQVELDRSEVVVDEPAVKSEETHQSK